VRLEESVRAKLGTKLRVNRAGNLLSERGGMDGRWITLHKKA